MERIDLPGVLFKTPLIKHQGDSLFDRDIEVVSAFWADHRALFYFLSVDNLPTVVAFDPEPFRYLYLSIFSLKPGHRISFKFQISNMSPSSRRMRLSILNPQISFLISSTKGG